MLTKSLIAALICALSPLPALACTLWGAASADVGGDAGGTLISKNRDGAPNRRQTLKKVRPKNGRAYFGLFAQGNGDPGLKAGVNEKGLTIVSAASSSLPRSVRAQQTDMHGVMVKILTDYATVDALIANADQVFSQSRANFFLVSDHSKVLTVEVGLKGQDALRVDNSGITTHTNHDLDPDLELANHAPQKIGTSSRTRYQRINTLLGQSGAPHTLAQFTALSRDPVDGPDNSLRRNGKERTLAS